MSVLFEDFICHIIEVQSGAQMGKDPGQKGRLSQFVTAHRIKKRDEAVARVKNPEERKKIASMYDTNIEKSLSDVRKGIIANKMKALEREHSKSKPFNPLG